ncbi:unnamed protein product, partial [Lactuca virosa]
TLPKFPNLRFFFETSKIDCSPIVFENRHVNNRLLEWKFLMQAIQNASLFLKTTWFQTTKERDPRTRKTPRMQNL